MFKFQTTKSNRKMVFSLAML